MCALGYENTALQENDNADVSDAYAFKRIQNSVVEEEESWSISYNTRNNINGGSVECEAQKKPNLLLSQGTPND